jgi:ribonuclease BN (tRNA processing enzyme)
MKYLLKAITTNNRDMKTAIIYTVQEKHYLFNCPDCFQRGANQQKVKFRNIRNVFLPSCRPDHFSGFPGFFMSSREGLTEEGYAAFEMIVVSPDNAPAIMENSACFMGDVSNNLTFKPWPENSKEMVEGTFQYIVDFN